MTVSKRRLAFWIVVAAVAAGVMYWWAGQANAALWQVKAWADAGREYVQAAPVLAWLALVGVCAVVINCPVPMAAIIKLMAGYIFGVGWGAGMNISTSVLGGALGFLAARHLFYHALYSRFSHQLAKANLEIARNGFWYVLSCRFFLPAPFYLVNALAGLSNLRLRKFLLATGLGVIPSSFIYAITGSHLETVRSLSDVMTLPMGLILAALGALAMVPALARRKEQRRAKKARQPG